MKAIPLSHIPNGDYFSIQIKNKTQENGSGTSNNDLYISLVSQNKAYEFTKFQTQDGKTVCIATPQEHETSHVSSTPLSELVNRIDGGYGFYVQVRSGSTSKPLIGGRLYFADKQNAVPGTPAKPGGIEPDAKFNFDFIEFTVDLSNHQLNLDTTQVDQFGMPIFVQAQPHVANFKDGIGIRPGLTREGPQGRIDGKHGGIIGAFATYTAKNSPFSAYDECVVSKKNEYGPSAVKRLLAPQHVLTNDSKAQLSAAFDEALYCFFNMYRDGPEGGGKVLYIVGNGSHGPEIFAGKVIQNFQVEDHKSKTSQGYTVLQLTGTKYKYDGSGATLKGVGNTGGAIYQIYYPYFTDSEHKNTHNTDLSSRSPAPFWFGAFSGSNQKYNLPITSASLMVFAGSGCFADNTSQYEYYKQRGDLGKFDSNMLGNLENQLVTMLNRGISPDTGCKSLSSNMHLRTGSNSESDLMFVDLSQKKNATANSVKPSASPQPGAFTAFNAKDLLNNIKCSEGNDVIWNGVHGLILWGGNPIQIFHHDADSATPKFKLRPYKNAQNSKKENYVNNIIFIPATDTQPAKIQFNWHSASNLINSASFTFKFDYAPKTKEAHYATLQLFSPYGNHHHYSFKPDSLGPASDFSSGLIGKRPSDKPTSGMTITGIQLNNPTYLYSACSSQPDVVTIYSPQGLKPINTNILTFSDFYPLDGGKPIGSWNAYAAFFHKGDPLAGYAAPTVGGRGYAFAFDDNGGYSSDMSISIPASSSVSVSVFTTLTLTLLPWWHAPAGRLKTENEVPESQVSDSKPL